MLGKKESLMKCVFCGASNTRVVRTFLNKDNRIRRRRECRRCKERFSTWEFAYDGIEELEAELADLMVRLRRCEGKVKEVLDKRTGR
jgi:hypothetical protein